MRRRGIPTRYTLGRGIVERRVRRQHPAGHWRELDRPKPALPTIRWGIWVRGAHRVAPLLGRRIDHDPLHGPGEIVVIDRYRDLAILLGDGKGGDRVGTSRGVDPHRVAVASLKPCRELRRDLRRLILLKSRESRLDRGKHLRCPPHVDRIGDVWILKFEIEG